MNSVSITSTGQIANLESLGEGDCPLTDLGEGLVGDGLRGDRAGGVAGVDARLLDVLHDAADHNLQRY